MVLMGWAHVTHHKMDVSAGHTDVFPIVSGIRGTLSPKLQLVCSLNKRYPSVL